MYRYSSPIFVATFLLLGALPVYAQSTPQDFRGVVAVFISIIDYLILVVFALSLLVFLWGITKAWVLGGGDEKSVSSGKQIAVAGIIGLVVMVGVWGLVALIQTILL